ncbi:MAG: hypothetical protein ACI9SK_000008 [Zhongshania sp.]|jgi:hypothetical protein
MTKKISYWLVAIFLMKPVNLVCAEVWTLEREVKGVQVYSSPVSGSAIKAIRGVTTVKSSLNRLVTLVADPALRSHWDSFCGESYLYETVTANEELVYLHIDLPWPVSDRDMLNRVVIHQNPDTLAITIKSAATQNILALKKGSVRMVVASNDWTLMPLANGFVEVTTTAHVDPAGPIPVWLLNTLSVESPFSALKSINELVDNEVIVGKAYSSIREASR